MSWARLDDHIAFHAKIVAAGNEAVGAWVRMICWSSSQLTDGDVPDQIAAVIAQDDAVIKRLTDVQLLDRVGDRLRIHDFLDWNPTAESVKADRARKVEARAKAGKLGGVASGMARRSNGAAAGEANAKQNEAPSHPIPSQKRSDRKKPEETPAASPLFDFESVYAEFPRKLGRKKGLQACVSRVRTPEQHRDLEQAVRNYARSVEGTDPKFVKHFDTFMNCWEDYIEWKPETPATKKYANFSEPMPHAATGGKVDL